MIGAVLCLLLQGGDDFAAGRTAYAEGRFGDAQKAFASALATAGDDASAELWYDQALAALQAGDLAVAEAAAERAAARGGPAFAARRDFLRGSAAFARCLQAEAQALAPEAEPFAFDVALQHGTTAVRHWQQAVLVRGGWSAAARNIERAQQKLADLRAEQAAAALQRQDKKVGARPEVHLVPQQQGEDQTAATQPGEQEVAAKVQRTELSPAEVQALFARVQQKQQQKLQLRQQLRARMQGTVERDW